MRSEGSPGWVVHPLGDLCQIFDGPHATPKETQSGPIFLGISSLKNGRLDLTETRHLSEEDFIRWTRRVTPREGDLVFSYETRIGEAALIPNELQCCLGRRMGLLRPNGNVDSRFLLYAYLGPPFQEVIRERTVHGSTVDRILLTEMPGFPVHVPPLDEQQRIAWVLSSLDDKIENNRRIANTLEETAATLFKERFVDFSGESELVATDFGRVPDGWKLAAIGELLEDHVGGGWGAEEADDIHTEAAHVIRGTDIPPARYGVTGSVPFRFHKPNNLARRALKRGDIVLEVAGGSKDQPVGRSLLVTEPLLHELPGGAMCASFCKRLRVNSSVIAPELVYLHLRDLYDNGHIRKYSVQSTGISNFQFKYWLQDWKVPIPPHDYQEKAMSGIQLALNFIAQSGRENQVLAHVRDTLLPKLIAGEIRVGDAETVVEEESQDPLRSSRLLD